MTGVDSCTLEILWVLCPFSISRWREDHLSSETNACRGFKEHTTGGVVRLGGCRTKHADSGFGFTCATCISLFGHCVWGWNNVGKTGLAECSAPHMRRQLFGCGFSHVTSPMIRCNENGLGEAFNQRDLP